MDKIQFYIILALIGIFISGGLYIKHLENVIENDRFEYQKLKQNNDSNNVKISNDKIFIDSLKNKMILLETELLTKDTVYIDTSKVDTIYSQINPDSSITYTYEDSLETPRFKLNIKSIITIKNTIPLESFIIKHLQLFPDTINTYLIFDIQSKLLSSRASVNGVIYESESNIYDLVYKGIYKELISELHTKSKWKWWHNFGANVGIGYNAYGDILPVATIGYGITLGDIFR